MIKRLKKVVNAKVFNIHKAAYVLAAANFLNLLLALLRDRLFVAKIGPTAELDAYYAAFKLPDTLYALLASFLSAFVVLPLIQNKNEEERWNFLFSIAATFFLVSSLVIFIFWVITPYYLQSFFGEILQNVNKEDFVFLQRILLLQFLLLGISSLFNSLVQAQHKFIAYSLAPISYNLGIIFGLFFFYEKYGLKGLAVAVLLSAAVHLAANIIFASGCKVKVGALKIDLKEVKKLVALALPRNISLFVQQLSLLFASAIVASFATGALTHFQLAFNLQSAPFAIIAVSYSVASFPLLSRHFSEKRMKEFYLQIITAIRHLFLWVFIISSFLVVFRAHIVRIIFGVDKFSWDSTTITAGILAIFALSLIFQSLNILFTRAFYAASKTKEPLFVNFLQFFFFAFFTLVFISPLGKKALLLLADALRVNPKMYLELSVPFAFLLSSFLATFLFIRQMKKTLPDSNDPELKEAKQRIFKSLFQTLFAATLAGVSAKLMLNASSFLFGELNTGIKVAVHALTAALPAFAIYIAILWKLNNLELKEALRILKGRWKKR